MSNRVVMVIRQTPKAKQSARFNPISRKPVYTAADVRRAEDSAKVQFISLWHPRPVLDGPVTLKLVHQYPWLKKHTREERALRMLPKTTKPDNTNLRKLIEDAAEGVVYKNDAQVWCSSDQRYFCDVDAAQTLVEVRWNETSEGGEQ